jgi:diaminohydroxyphosphoribosylaminopyrimidine deaminase/5-amino-6-(5-phosphoribosylamino)uracil reductase
MTFPSQFMQLALDEARQALGLVSPNPAVGCVLVRDGQVVGRGHTQPPGEAHAEVMALRDAGEAARGATAYVTLEPCCMHGRTPPCTDALIEAGVVRVVIAIEDPDERVRGGGRRQLEEAGIAVEEGDGAEEASVVNEAFIKHRLTGLPFVVAKFAVSLDGKIASASGDSRWISSPESRNWGHRELRSTLDAIVVGVETVLKDNPELTNREGDWLSHRQPLRVVLDSAGRTPPDAKVLNEHAPTLIATTERSSSSFRDGVRAAGHSVAVVDAGEVGRVDPRAFLEFLAAERQVLSVLLEGGGRVHGAFFDAGLVDKVHAIIAPMVIGAGNAAGSVMGKGAWTMADAWRLDRVSVEQLGPDVLVTGYVRDPLERAAQIRPFAERLWSELHSWFDTDDGSLPEFEIKNVSPAGLAKMFEFLRERGTIRPDSHFWNDERCREELVLDQPELAKMVVSGVAVPPHFLVSIRVLDEDLPELGARLWPDGLSLNYRMGDEWNQPKVLAFFELLSTLCDLDADAVLAKWESVPLDTTTLPPLFAEYQGLRG